MSGWENMRAKVSHYFQPWPARVLEKSVTKSIKKVFRRESSSFGPSSSELWERQKVWRAFMDREYFQRRWIVQEVLLAKSITVHCGENTETWDNLLQSHYRVVDSSFGDSHYLDGINFNEKSKHERVNPLFFRLLQARELKIRRLHLLTLMRVFPGARCSDPTRQSVRIPCDGPSIR